MAREKNEYEPLEEYSKEIMDKMKSITGHCERVCKKFLDASIKSRETTNNEKAIFDWISNHFVPNTIIIDENKYEKIFSDAIKTIEKQNKITFGGSKRNFFGALTNKITGYLVEEGVVELARKHGVDLKVAHEEGNPEDFYETDFPEVIDGGSIRPANFKMGAKGSGSGALWFEVPHSQFKKSHFHAFGKAIYDEDHLPGFLLKWIRPNLIELTKKKYLDHDFLDNLFKAFEFKPIPVYIVGWVENDNQSLQYEYKGKMGRSVYTIQEYNGFLSKEYQRIIKKKENLDEKSKIQFLSIKEFSKSENSDLHVFNMGSFKKNAKQFNSFFSKF